MLVQLALNCKLIYSVSVFANDCVELVELNLLDVIKCKLLSLFLGNDCN